MREILFRGKRIDTGEWIKGSAINTQYDVKGDKHTYIGIFVISERYPLMKTIEWYEVIPETVGQYTGLTNRNGKEIFEGDIVKEEYEVFVSARAKEKRVKIGYVEYESNSLCCGYYAYFWNDKEKWRGNFAIHCGCETIGNIHDNPELLKGGAE